MNYIFLSFYLRQIVFDPVSSSNIVEFSRILQQRMDSNDPNRQKHHQAPSVTLNDEVDLLSTLLDALQADFRVSKKSEAKKYIEVFSSFFMRCHVC
jgi:hypothetical protein